MSAMDYSGPIPAIVPDAVQSHQPDVSVTPASLKVTAGPETLAGYKNALNDIVSLSREQVRYHHLDQTATGCL